MSVQKHVFGSNSEREYYHKLSRQWGNKYHIYHNLPFLNVFDMHNLLADTSSQFIDEIDYNRLKKTSIDFTLCDGNDTP